MSTENLVPRLRDIAESEAVRGFMVAEDLAAIRAAADALEDATASLDARWEHSDHLTAKYYQRMRAAEREMHARELHHFEEEKRSADLEAELARAQEVIEKAKAEAQRTMDADDLTVWASHAGYRAANRIRGVLATYEEGQQS